MRGVLNYPVPSRTVYTSFKTKEALEAIIAPKTVEFIKCQGCLESTPNLTVCSQCFEKILQKRLCFT